MFSGLCGAVIYTLDDAFNDIYDDCISFLYYVDDKEENILKDNDIDEVDIYSKEKGGEDE